ncbi:hypothetical protein E4P42_25540 [Mycobacterium sp. PS03-16]|uniref:hypothetical protein n=1 Tax=Mycobacterium sp. PS03-16 TaxID=2559611 RepID=UPI00107385C1|nr:hypothetical protein [Mycobacterium sp. PS03-16]TFV54560.1 hypothetical protein E4P42_25540 [Mycobacterium sp. PS03-16]
MAETPSRTVLTRATRRRWLAVTAASAAYLTLATPVASAEPSSDFPADDRGFVDTAAYCQGAAVATAFGRTADALVAICAGPGGELQYRGVRLRDDAAVMLTAQSDGAGRFVADNDGVVYTVSPTELTVTVADSTLHRQPMLEYRAPQPVG